VLAHCFDICALVLYIMFPLLAPRFVSGAACRVLGSCIFWFVCGFCALPSMCRLWICVLFFVCWFRVIFLYVVSVCWFRVLFCMCWFRVLLSGVVFFFHMLIAFVVARVLVPFVGVVFASISFRFHFGFALI